MGWGDTVSCQGFLCNISKNVLWRRNSQWADFCCIIFTLMFTYVGLHKVAMHFLAQTREVLNERIQKEQMPCKPACRAEASCMVLFPEQISLYSFFRIKKVREESPFSSQLGSPPSWPCKPFCTCVCSICAHKKTHCEKMWEWSITVCKTGCFGSFSAFLCFTACTAVKSC